MTLDDLGPRICILGPSNSGKSTLAHAIAQARAWPAIHLDQLHHRPNTDWRPRPEAEFFALHDAAIARERWVIDGNYSRCLPQRLARATGVILLDTSTARSLWRYVARCWFAQHRVGGLNGAPERVTWEMLQHLCVATRARRKRHADLFERLTLPKLAFATPGALAAFYRAERLAR